MSAPRPDALLVDGQGRAKIDPRKRKAKADRLAAARKRQRRTSGPSRPVRPVDRFANVAPTDRPMTAAQLSELAALSRDPFLNFAHKPTLTRGEADRLIPALRKLAKRRRQENQRDPSNRNRER